MSKKERGRRMWKGKAKERERGRGLKNNSEIYLLAQAC